jgi:hypothetical protein
LILALASLLILARALLRIIDAIVYSVSRHFLARSDEESHPVRSRQQGCA